jgi:hypothetical protein
MAIDATKLAREIWQVLKKKLTVPLGLLIFLFVLGLSLSGKTYQLLRSEFRGNQADEFQIEQLKGRVAELQDLYDQDQARIDTLESERQVFVDENERLKRQKQGLQNALNQKPVFEGTPDALADSLYAAWQRFRARR